MIELPSIDEAEGCIQCQIGSKLVLFVTGHCHWMCDYCPLSENRREIDFMYANERRVEIGDWSAVIQEGKAMNATGTGITCLLYTSPSPRDKRQSRMPSSA